MFLKQTHLLVRCMLLSAACAHAQEVPWHLGAQNASTAAISAINTVNVAPGPNKVVVAVIDSGVMPDHPSLAGQLLPGYDMQAAPNNLRGGRSTNFAPDERDIRCGSRLASNTHRTHGTEVASLVAGNGVNGVRGVNASAKVVPIKLMGACSMSRADLLDAISWAAGLPVRDAPPNPNPARVINMSIAGDSFVCKDDLQKLITRVVEEQKIFVVTAAGNNFRKPLPEPSNCKGVISVGALDAQNQVEVYSAVDPRTVIYAPGGGKRMQGPEAWRVNKLKVATYELDFKGTEQQAADYRGVGTSYAAPVVSGYVSLWLSYYPNKQPADFWTEMPNFMREVEAIADCPACAPKGLANKSLP
jgi:serine protease